MTDFDSAFYIFEGRMRGRRVTSSYDDDTEVARTSATVTRTAAEARALVGQSLVGLTVDPATHALTAQFTSAYVVGTFPDDPESDTLWTLRDPENSDVIRGTLQGIVRGHHDRVV